MTIRENADIENWIAKEPPEPVIEPDLPIIDPHHHLWDLRGNSRMGFRQEVYLCEEISRDIADSGHNIVQTVFAQCAVRSIERMAPPKCARWVRPSLFTALRR